MTGSATGYNPDDDPGYDERDTPPTMAIWKFPIRLPDAVNELVTVELPAGATICKIAEQGQSRFFLWALVCVSIKKEERRMEKRLVLAVETGHEFSAKALADIALIAARTGKKTPYDYQETVLAMDGRFVVHFFVSHPTP